jgi:hypothetical protein
MPAKGPICVGFSDQATKFPMADEFSMDNLEAFVTKMEAGELEAHMKSEGAVDNTGKANLKLTARNYKDHVDGTKDTFIKFYS